MKKLICIFLAICLLFSLASCKKKNKNPTNENNTKNTDATVETNGQQMEFDDSLIAVSVPAVTQNTTEKNGTILFQYTYQNMSLVLDKPQVADKIIVDFLNRVDKTATPAKDIEDMAKSAYQNVGNWVPYLYHITYSPTRIDHKVLSFFGNNVVFSGAGHPERTCVSASYDLLTGDVLTLASIMHKDSTAGQLCNLVLEGLSEMAEGDYLYDGYKSTVKQRFTHDPTQDEDWYFSQTGLCFYFAPYEIAPYSSGVITVEIPYEKLKNIVHEAYLPSARNVPSGQLTVSPFKNVNMNDFSHIAEIITETEGNMYMVHTNGNVQDVRIVMSDNASNYTAFAAYGLVPGNGIMIQGNNDSLKNMRLSYKSGKDTITAPVIG